MPNARTTNLYPKPTTGVLDQDLDVAGSVVQFGTAFNSLTRYIVLDVQDADVFVTYDGSDPVKTSGSENGHKLFAGRSYTWAKETASVARFIQSGSVTARIHASEFTD
jgi:hypothetical protein